MTTKKKPVSLQELVDIAGRCRALCHVGCQLCIYEIIEDLKKEGYVLKK